MYVLKVAIATTATPIIPVAPVVKASYPFQNLIFQNNSTGIIYVGDNAVSATNGIAIAAGAQLAINCTQGYTEDLNGWFAIAATAGNLVVLVIP